MLENLAARPEWQRQLRIRPEIQVAASIKVAASISFCEVQTHGLNS
jgi:hypothetical protein